LPGDDELAFERKLYIIRKRIQSAIQGLELKQRNMFYVPSLSHKTLILQGHAQCPAAHRILSRSRQPSRRIGAGNGALALQHEYLPNWARAHPYRYLCHNGEINTLRGNINWMHARESLFESDLFGRDIKKILPVIDSAAVISGMFDNALEMLVLTGRSLPHAVMMMIPEPYAGHESMSAQKKAFYEYHACLMEPWDGPASIAFSDGIRIGAVLDRNGCDHRATM